MPSRAPALFGLGIALAATLVAWALAGAYVEAQERERFALDAEGFELALQDRIQAYEQVLAGGVALFDASGGWVTRSAWYEYHEALGLQDRFPGIGGFGFAEHIEPGNLSAHVERVRAEGFPDYAVKPAGEREVYTSIVYLEPFEGRNLRAFGFDMYSEPVRRAAMERARDTGEAALSGKVTLVQENGTDVQSGFLLYMAVYRDGAPTTTVEERRAALVGYVYSPFRSNDFMEGLQEQAALDLVLRIYDGPEPVESALLFDSAPGEPAGHIERASRLTLAGREWTLVESSTAGSVPPGLSLLPAAILAGGLLASALLFGILWSLARTRQRAFVMAEAMTAELQARTRDLEASNEALRAFSYVVSHDLKEPVRGIDSYLRVLHEDHATRMPPDARSLVESAQRATDRLAGLLRSLLELSRVDRGLLATRPVDVAALLRDPACHAAYDTVERERGARVDAEPMPRVLAAPSVLAQALGNLVGNAIRHNARQPPRVLVHGAAAGDVVEIVIEDDGDGFPPGFTEAFNRGQLASGGFGLLLAQRAVERLHGRVVLGRGQRLGGAAVTLTLPAAPR